MRFHAEYVAVIGLIASLAGCAHKTVAPTVANAPQSRYSHLTAAGLAGAAQGPMEADAQRKFAAELKDRILPAETLDPGGEATGVYLFPIVYKPRALVIEYTVDGASQSLRMPLTPTPSGSIPPG